MKRVFSPSSRELTPTPAQQHPAQAIEAAVAPNRINQAEQTLQTLLAGSLWVAIEDMGANPVIQQLLMALRGNELQLYHFAGHLVERLVPGVWQAYAELAAARGSEISAVYLPPGLGELPRGVALLPNLSYIELPVCQREVVDCRGALHPDLRGPVLNLCGSDVSEVFAPKGATVRCPGGNQCGIRISFYDPYAETRTGVRAKAERHVYFREPTEFADPGQPVTDELRDDIVSRNFNGMATFPNSDIPIWCNALAFQWLTDMLHLKPGERFSYDPYSHPDGLTHHVRADAQANFERFLRDGPGGFLLRPQNWGAFLAQQWSELAPDGSRRLFLLTCKPNQGIRPGHAMGLAIRGKTSPQRADLMACSLVFYDPNLTTTHQRLIETHTDPSTLKLEDLISLENHFATDYPQDRFLRAIPFEDPFMPPDPATRRTVDLGFAWPAIAIPHRAIDRP